MISGNIPLLLSKARAPQAAHANTGKRQDSTALVEKEVQSFLGNRAESGHLLQVRANHAADLEADIQAQLKLGFSLHRRMTATSPKPPEWNRMFRWCCNPVTEAVVKTPLRHSQESGRWCNPQQTRQGL